MSKVLIIFSLLGLLLAIFVYNFIETFQYFFSFPSSLYGKVESGLLTPEDLSEYDGVRRPFLYLALLGQVFNVTKGAKHYARGQQYHFFVGKDASRNFINGIFDEGQASDHVIDLTLQELKSLKNWLDFYRKEYHRVGYVIGRYYDDKGQRTVYGHKVDILIKEAQQQQRDNERLKYTFPACNVEWDPVKGSRVWCSNKSGGVARDWIGKPRQYFEPGSDSFRCACISEANESLGTVKEYAGCDRDSESCYVQSD